MTLLRDGEHLTGSYFYPKVGKNIALSGTIDKDGNVSISESDDSGKQTGVFKREVEAATDSPDPPERDRWQVVAADGSKELRFWCRSSRWNSPAPMRFAPKVIKEANKEKHYTVDAVYPQIEGDARFDKFNREARSLITKDVAAFKTAETVEPTSTDNVLADEARDRV